ncbi:MAG: glutaredoxin family protein [Betaproteobacteria bacterium]|nr:glutaredoxin family protein [Betaproteobacteria bacterium]MCC7216794.1 glutaredoxin family protein [Burkholderiales bacterium]
MSTLAHRTALGLAALALATAAIAQAPQVYRYKDADGRIVYSDRPPPPSAQGVQMRSVGGNFVETSEPSLAAQQAAERFPVTLFTFDCGEVCQSAEAVLNRRGVPFSKVDVQTDEQGRARMKELTGDDKAPVLAVGDKLVAKGYNESRWQTLLDEAGYPKTQAPRRAAPAARTAEAAPPPPQPLPEGMRSLAPPPRGGDYPKQ